MTTLQEQLAAAKREAEALAAKARDHKRRANDSGYGYNPYIRDADAALAKVVALAKRIEEEAFAATWTAETTAARRAEWNAWVHANTGPKGVPTAKVRDRQAKQGWTHHDLKKAIAFHNL